MKEILNSVHVHAVFSVIIVIKGSWIVIKLCLYNYTVCHEHYVLNINFVPNTNFIYSQHMSLYSPTFLINKNTRMLTGQYM